MVASCASKMPGNCNCAKEKEKKKKGEYSNLLSIRSLFCLPGHKGDVKKATGQNNNGCFRRCSRSRLYFGCCTGSLLVLSIIHLFVFPHLFIHSSPTHLWRQQHRTPKEDVARRRISIESLTRSNLFRELKIAELGEDASVWAWCTRTDGASGGIIHKAWACTLAAYLQNRDTNSAEVSAFYPHGVAGKLDLCRSEMGLIEKNERVCKSLSPLNIGPAAAEAQQKYLLS